MREENRSLRTSPQGYGCDEPAHVPVFKIICPACDGAGCEEKVPYKQGDELMQCNGTGYLVSFICPARFVGDRRDLRSALDFYLLALGDLGGGQLPRTGGWLKQSASFKRFCRLMETARAQLQRKSKADGST